MPSKAENDAPGLPETPDRDVGKGAAWGEFDPETHTFTAGGQRLCGVTETLASVGILPDYDFIDAIGTYYRDRGTAVHQAIALDLLGCLDESSVDEEVAARLNRARRYIELRKLTPVFIEQPLYCIAEGFAGIPDAVLRQSNGTLVVTDWKSGAYHPGHKVQVAGAYRVLLLQAARENRIPCSVNELMRARYEVVPLTAEIPRAVVVERPEDYPPLFRAALAVHRWRLANLPAGDTAWIPSP